MRRSTTTALLTALAALTALALPAQAAAPTVALQPDRLTRGADVAVPHIEDGVFVDGDRRVELPGTVARVIGPSTDGWLVGTSQPNAVGETLRRDSRVVDVLPDGTVRTVLRRVAQEIVVASEDGSTLLAVPAPGRTRAAVKAWSVADGSLVASRAFRGYPEVVTAEGRRALVRTTTRTFWWNIATDTVRPVTKRLTGLASTTHDLLATYTKDPYLGGCTELVRLSDRSDVVWRSCRERVAAISPDGTQLLTFHILTDGLGPGEIHLRELDDTLLATWSTNWFGDWRWESPGVVLLDVNGKRTSATVRCTLGQCEDATDPVKVQAP